MYYLIYKITNTLDGKIYVGAHRTKKLDDGYMGSGKYLNNAINKHGVEHFTKEILCFTESEDEMFSMESVLVNKEFIERKDTYNIREGGKGGWTDSERRKGYEAAKSKMITAATEAKRILRETDAEWAKGEREIMSRRGTAGGLVAFLGKQHSNESKKKIGEANSKHQTGKGNSQYGSMWITNGIENKKIPKDSTIPEGFRKGRKIKHIHS